MGSILKSNSNLKVGVRVSGGFAAVLLLLVALAAVSYFGLKSTQDAFTSYATISVNTQSTLKIDRDFTALRQNALAYVTNGSEAALKSIGELRQSLSADIKDEISRLIIPAVHDKMSQVGGLVEQFGSNQDILIQKKKERDHAFNEMMVPLATKLQAALADMINTAMKDGDMATAARAGIAQEALMSMRVASLRYLLTPDQQFVEAGNKAGEALTAALSPLKQSVKSTEQQDRLRIVEDTAPQYRAAFTAAAAAIQDVDKIFNVTNAKVAAEIETKLAELKAIQVASLKQISDKSKAEISSTIAQSLSVSIGAVLLGAFLAWLIGRGITRPVAGMTKAMTVLARGDTSVEIPSRDNKDEIGDMAKAVQVFKDNMIETERLRAEQEQHKKRAEEERRKGMLELADKFEATVGGVVKTVSAAATELQATAQAMAATAEETSRQSTAVAAASEQATTNVQTVSSATEELSSSIKEITKQVEESTHVVGESAKQATETNTRVQRLKESVQKIDTVVNLINDIASQTNLLALNATIEAARAGEAGKGFAVVASEVKALATQTAKATEEIATQIREIQEETDQSVQSIGTITQTIGQVNTIATSIAAAVDQQGAATQEIARSVAQAAQGTSEVSSNIVSVNEASKQTGAAATQMLSAAQELSMNGETLKTQVENFLREVRAA